MSANFFAPVLRARRPSPVEGEIPMSATSRTARIASLVQQRRISRLVHFTRIRNLGSILQHGLVNRHRLAEIHPQFQPRINDHRRWDDHLDASCISIEFPNYRMFYPYRLKTDEAWIVLSLDPAILWKQACAFYPGNAASNLYRYTPVEHFSTPEAFASMFEDRNGVARKSLGIPHAYPTDPQAEVLVFDVIPPAAIVQVSFEDRDTLNDWAALHPHTSEDLLTVNRHLFDARQDYRFWKSQPVEIDTDEVPF